jgi:hypothetical protein
MDSINLTDWTVLYVKHRDVIAKKLVDVKQEKDHITFTYKDGVTVGYALEKLAVPALNTKQNKAIITTLQTKENVDFLIKHWKDFSSHNGLTMIFVNLKTNEKWLIHPHTHSQIAEAKFEPGVRSLADSISYM